MQEILRNKKDINIFDRFNKFFIKQKEFIAINELNDLIKIKNIAEIDKTKKIYGVNTLQKATKNEISFLTNKKYVEDLQNSKAGFCFIDENHKNYIPENTIPIVVDNPHYSYCVFLNEMYFIPLFLINTGISEKANVDKTAKIGKNVEIQTGAFIGENVVIGNNCKICVNAVINHDCVIGDGSYIGANTTISYAEIGNNTIIQNGANIGQCGFGFAHNTGFNYKIPQLGIVKIGNNVEIGAGTCIDRGALEDTIIGDNTKIDNLVQIAHGVKVGIGCFFASQVGISGSTKVGNFVQFGGQTGIAGHVKIGDMVQAAGQTGIASDIEKGMVIGGSPALPIKDWHRSSIIMKKFINNKKKNKNE
mgnify:FL=1